MKIRTLGGGYSTPVVERIDIEVEKGFAQSEIGLPGLGEETGNM